MRKRVKQISPDADILMPLQHRGKAQLSIQKVLRQYLKQREL